MVQSNTILSGLVGSHAYGLATHKSDIDIMSVFLGDEDTYLGVDYTDKLTKEIKAEGYEETAYELRKYAMMCCNSNPNALPLLFLKDYKVITPAGQALLNIKDLFITKDIIRTFGAFALSEIKKVFNTEVTGEMGAKRKALVEKHGYNTKSALHAMRMATMCYEVAAASRLTFDRTKLDANYLLEIKQGLHDKDRICFNLKDVVKCAQEKIKYSPLPDKPDKAKVNEVIKGIIKKYVIN